MKTLYAPPPLSPQAKPSHASQARQGVLVTDPKLVLEIYQGIQNHPFPKKGICPVRLIKESPEVCETIAKRLGLNTENFKVSTFQLDSFQTFAEKQEEFSNRSGHKHAPEKASIKPLNFIIPKGSEESPVALQVGQYYQEFEAKGPQRRQSAYVDACYGKEYKNVPGSIYLTNSLGESGYLNNDYLDTLVPLVAQKIDQHPRVVGSIHGGYNKGEQIIYKGLGTPDTLNAFLYENPDMFLDQRQIRKWYG